MNHPFDWIPWNYGRGTLFTLSSVAAIAVLAFLGKLDEPLRIENVAPRGMVSFELAFSVDKAREIVGEWKADARANAAQSLLWDYGLIFLYAANFSYACLLSSRYFAGRKWSVMSGIASSLACGQVLAGYFDCVENGCLLYILTRLDADMAIAQPWPMIAAVAAYAKFALLGCGLFCAIVASVCWLKGCFFPG